jgi:hypothetical protein
LTWRFCNAILLLTDQLHNKRGKSYTCLHKTI